MHLTKKENEIERIEYNLATAATPKIQETCAIMLEKAEAERGDPLSKNEFLFTYGLKSSTYGKKENGQTLKNEDLSALAPPTVEILNIWRDFRKVVDFIDANREWIVPLLQRFETGK